MSKSSTTYQPATSAGGSWYCCLPVRPNSGLSFGETHFSRAYETVQFSFDTVLRIRRGTQLRPQVPRIPRIAAQLQRNEMILLVVSNVHVRVSVFADLLYLQSVGVGNRRSNRFGIALDTNGLFYVALRHRGVDHSGRARRIGKPVN